MKKQSGITLVTLVITIIILLILASITISSLTNTGLFEKSKEAGDKTQNAAENQAKTLNEYEDELNKYISGTTGENLEKLADKVKVGDYVKYIPDALDSNAISTLKANLNTYSGNSNSTVNTAIKRDDLKWRVLDVQNGQVRLISETPTISKIELYGYNGYNNAVKLLDDTCSTLYNNSKLASKVQNLKIEDIEEKMKETENRYDKYNDNFDIDADKFYPEILKKEKGQEINEVKGNELGISEQKNFIGQEEKKKANKLRLKYTYYLKEIKDTDFNNNKYYEIFIKNQDKYFSYFMSSRCVGVSSEIGCFFIRNIDSGKIDAANCAYFSNNYQNIDKDSFRPIVTLNSNVQIDTSNSGDGSTAEQAYVIK